MKKLFLILSLILFTTGLFAQKFMTQNGTIRFFSETPVENIEAVNQQVSSVIDLENGTLAFSLLMKAFVFEKALMQEHFNEKYVHSDQFPKATFKGKIIGLDGQPTGGESKEYKVAGTLTMHGKSKEIETTAKISGAKNQIKASSVFSVKLADFDISVPSAVTENIAESIEISVDMDYDKL